MSPDLLKEALATIGWSARELARRTGRTDSAGGEWIAGRREIPQDVAAWLLRQCRRLNLDPPPRRQP